MKFANLFWTLDILNETVLIFIIFNIFSSMYVYILVYIKRKKNETFNQKPAFKII